MTLILDVVDFLFGSRAAVAPQYLPGANVTLRFVVVPQQRWQILNLRLGGGFFITDFGLIDKHTNIHERTHNDTQLWKHTGKLGYGQQKTAHVHRFEGWGGGCLEKLWGTRGSTNYVQSCDDVIDNG